VISYGLNLITKQVTGYHVARQSNLPPSNSNFNISETNGIFNRTLEVSSCS